MAKSNIDKLMELKKLYEEGILTKEEMEAEKAKILNASASSDESTIKETPSVDTSESSNSIDKGNSHNKKVIWGAAAVIVVAIVSVIGFFLNKQTEPKEAVTDDIELPQLTEEEPYIDCIKIKDLFEIIRKDDSNELRTFLKNIGFKANGKDEEYSSAIWSKMYGLGAESDTVSIQMEKIRELVYLDLICTKDAIMNKWISEIKELGYTFEESSVEGEDKTLSFNKSNGISVLVQYMSSPKRNRLNVITNFALIVENDDNSDDVIARDDAYKYNFVGKINGSTAQYPFRMAININDDGNVSGYYVVTDGDSERVSLKGSVRDWPDKFEGVITLHEFDESKNDYTGFYFVGSLLIDHSQSGSFAGYTIKGRYRNDPDIAWPFFAESM